MDQFADLVDEFAACESARRAVEKLSSDRAAGHLGAVLDALARLRSEPSSDSLLTSAAQHLSGSRIFDRVLWSDISGSMWTVQVLCTSDRQTDQLDSRPGDARTIPLASPLIEAEVVRRRMPALVNDAPNEPRTYNPWVLKSKCNDYVVAPVVAMSTVIGLLHADRVSGTPVTEADRDLLRLFAEGFGVLYERAVLAERVEAQRQTVAEACGAALRALADFDVHPELSPASSATLTHRSSIRKLDQRESSRLSRLTGREREVLELLASGATNAQLADRLTVAESTVKTHVKHILHKLGAANRAEAIACYLTESRRHDRRL